MTDWVYERCTECGRQIAQLGDSPWAHVDTGDIGCASETNARPLRATKVKLLDIEDMPDWNPKSNTTGRRERGVTDGLVFFHERNGPSCTTHGALLCVNEDRTIWRCIACGSGTYVEWPDA